MGPSSVASQALQVIPVPFTWAGVGEVGQQPFGAVLWGTARASLDCWEGAGFVRLCNLVDVC